MNLVFDPQLRAADVAVAVDSIESTIRSRYPKITRIYIEARPQ